MIIQIINFGFNMKQLLIKKYHNIKDHILNYKMYLEAQVDYGKY